MQQEGSMATENVMRIDDEARAAVEAFRAGGKGQRHELKTNGQATSWLVKYAVRRLAALDSDRARKASGKPSRFDKPARKRKKARAA
jgi:hypothetical protein